MGRIARAALAYFAAVYAAGFLLGLVREVAVRPRLGATAAIAFEAPLVLAASFLAARWAVRGYELAKTRQRLGMGLAAFGLLIVAEFAGAIALRGMAPMEWLVHFVQPPGLLSLALFLMFTAMPAIVGRFRP